jgi:hypothetical protein
MISSLILDDRRLMDLKRLAAERGTTISAVVNEFLADGIRRSRLPRKRVMSPTAISCGRPWSGIEVPDRYQYSAAGAQPGPSFSRHHARLT